MWGPTPQWFVCKSSSHGWPLVQTLHIVKTITNRTWLLQPHHPIPCGSGQIRETRPKSHPDLVVSNSHQGSQGWTWRFQAIHTFSLMHRSLGPVAIHQRGSYWQSITLLSPDRGKLLVFCSTNESDQKDIPAFPSHVPRHGLHRTKVCVNGKRSSFLAKTT